MLDERADAGHFGSGAGRGHDGTPLATGDHRAPRTASTCDPARGAPAATASAPFRRGWTFTRERRLVAGEAVGLEDASIGGHHVSCLTQEDVADHQLGGRDHRHPSVAHDACRSRLERAPGGEQVFTATLDRVPDGRVEADDEDNRAGLKHVAEDERSGSRPQQQPGGKVRHLSPENSIPGVGRRWLQLVATVLA